MNPRRPDVGPFSSENLEVKDVQRKGGAAFGTNACYEIQFREKPEILSAFFDFPLFLLLLLFWSSCLVRSWSRSSRLALAAIHSTPTFALPSAARETFV